MIAAGRNCSGIQREAPVYEAAGRSEHDLQYLDSACGSGPAAIFRQASP